MIWEKTSMRILDNGSQKLLKENYLDDEICIQPLLKIMFTIHCMI